MYKKKRKNVTRKGKIEWMNWTKYFFFFARDKNKSSNLVIFFSVQFIIILYTNPQTTKTTTIHLYTQTSTKHRCALIIFTILFLSSLLPPHISFFIVKYQVVKFFLLPFFPFLFFPSLSLSLLFSSLL